MPVKRLNFTNRARLTREKANVYLLPGEPASFKVELDLSHLNASAANALVFVEAYRGTTRMRFPLGTVANIVHPPPEDMQLTEFDNPSDVSFRVKVTDVDRHLGRIIAWANNIRPSGNSIENHADLVRWRDIDLHGLLWDIEFDENGPIVSVERNIGSSNIGQSGQFIAAAYPEILRRVLLKALIEDNVSPDDPEHWFFEWSTFYLPSNLGVGEVPQPSQDFRARYDWIQDAVYAFGRKFLPAEQWQGSAIGEGVA